MKQLFFIFSFFAFGAMAAIAQDGNGPVMTFEKTTHNFGVINYKADGLHKFKFTNTGNEPLNISSVIGSCKCTVPTYPKDPIMPGETAYIDVTYDTNRVGPFNKQLTVTTNERNSNYTLTVKGEVKAPPTQESVPTGNGGK